MLLFQVTDDAYVTFEAKDKHLTSSKVMYDDIHTEYGIDKSFRRFLYIQDRPNWWNTFILYKTVAKWTYVVFL